MVLYRLTKPKYAEDLSGTGAKAFGGRWNSKGNAMLYLASSRALAVLEVLVHLAPLIIPDTYRMVTLKVPDDFDSFDTKLLPQNWAQNPDDFIFKKAGDQFLNENKYLLLKVPSSIVSEEFNFLLNPLHNYAAKIKIVKSEPFNFDSRLL